jgi:hypothetical protein
MLGFGALHKSKALTLASASLRTERRKQSLQATAADLHDEVSAAVLSSLPCLKWTGFEVEEDGTLEGISVLAFGR